MTRLNQILIVLLVLQLLVGAFVFLPRTLTTEAEVEALLPGLDADQVRALTITSGEGESLALVRVDGDWVVASAGDYAVLEEKVPEFLAKVVAMQTDRLVTETPGSHERLQVAGDDFQRLVEIEASDGSRHVFYIGSAPSYGAAHVRAEGQDEVYLTSELSAQDAGARIADWVDTSFVSLPQEEVTAFTLANQQGTWTFVKEGETWTMTGLEGGEILNTSAVQTLVNRATTVTMQEPLGTEEEAAYGLDDPLAMVTLVTTAGTHTLRIGARDEGDDTYVIAWSGSPYYVRVGEFAVRDLVDKARKDLLQQPTPTG